VTTVAAVVAEAAVEDAVAAEATAEAVVVMAAAVAATAETGGKQPNQFKKGASAPFSLPALRSEVIRWMHSAILSISARVLSGSEP